MPKKNSKKLSDKKQKERHRFFLNPYSDSAFTKCPKCDAKTKIRKFPLVIHIQPQQLFILNKQCRYCENCDLIITKKQEIESLMAAGFIQSNPKIIGNDYLVMGTVDRKDWKEGTQNALSPSEMLERIYVFQDVWDFEVIPAGWYRSE
ncbi:hypothetical protein BV372_10630 [Nostoc sp. T09]|uniref:hypothetical protein n=1 Tax=Nostoc sp. T09 TaxID=1932621 RepID=UPI000A37C707|nr:hypothetical protein [Nostoc sp. T09]OUL35580.1 hypothetical protein BV372_10630 [Nostoc sp. T09]